MLVRRNRRSAGGRATARAAEGHAASPAANRRKRRRSIEPPPGSSSEPFQQALDVIELDLRAEALAGAAAQLVQDLPGPLQRIQIWDLHIPLVVGTVVGHRPTERVALDPIPWCAVGGSDLVAAGIDGT